MLVYCPWWVCFDLDLGVDWSSALSIVGAMMQKVGMECSKVGNIDPFVLIGSPVFWPVLVLYKMDS